MATVSLNLALETFDVPTEPPIQITPQLMLRILNNLSRKYYEKPFIDLFLHEKLAIYREAEDVDTLLTLLPPIPWDRLRSEQGPFELRVSE